MNHWIWFALGAASFLLNDLIWQLWTGYRVRKEFEAMDTDNKGCQAKAMAEIKKDQSEVVDEDSRRRSSLTESV